MRAAVDDRLKPALDALQHGAQSHEDANSAEWAAPAVDRRAGWARDPVPGWKRPGMRALGDEDAFQDHVAELTQR
jgi:hypothetical protein